LVARRLPRRHAESVGDLGQGSGRHKRRHARDVLRAGLGPSRRARRLGAGIFGPTKGAQRVGRGATDRRGTILAVMLGDDSRRDTLG